MENKMFYQDGKKRFLYDYIFFETTNPIFFSCVDEKKDIYIATLCDDRKELRWILAKTSESQLMDILKQMMKNWQIIWRILIKKIIIIYIMNPFIKKRNLSYRRDQLKHHTQIKMITKIWK